MYQKTLRVVDSAIHLYALYLVGEFAAKVFDKVIKNR